MFEGQLKAIDSFDVTAEFRKIIKELSFKFIELNKKNLSEGKRSDGKKLPPYSDAYAKKKNKSKGLKTLFDKGGFHGGLNLYTEPVLYVEIKDSDWKTEILKHNWGVEIIGITDEDIALISRMALNMLNERIIRAFS